MDENLILLQKASAEIKSLRSQNQAMSLRLDMFDKCFVLLRANSPSGGDCCMGEDIAYRIDKMIEQSQSKDSSKSEGLPAQS